MAENKFNIITRYLRKESFLFEVILILIFVNLGIIIIFNHFFKSPINDPSIILISIIRAIVNIVIIFTVLYIKYFSYILLINDANSAFIAGDSKLSRIDLKKVPNNIIGDLIKSRENLLYLAGESAKTLEEIIANYSRQKEKLRAILYNISDIVIVTDKNLNIELVNNAAQIFLNKREAEIKNNNIEKEILILDKNKNIIKVKEVIDECINNKIAKEIKDIYLPTAYKDLINANAIFTPIFDVNNLQSIESVICVIQDISEITKADKLKDDFIATLSHELKTPLTPIKGFAELLSNNEYPNEKVKYYAQIIFEQANKLQNLISQLLTLKELEEGSADKKLKVVNVCEFLKENINKLQNIFTTHKIKFLSEENNINIEIDNSLIARVMEMLINNAVKFSPANSVINVGYEESNNFKLRKIKIKVIDEGIGVPDIEKELIFSKFYRLDRRDDRNFYGSGLGLSIARHIIELHKGELKVEDNIVDGKVKGSVFYFVLPVAEYEKAITN